MAYLGDDIEVGAPVRLGISATPGAVSFQLGAVNIFTNWSLDYPVTGRTNYIPAIVLDEDDPVPSGTLVGTVILRKASTEE